ARYACAPDPESSVLPRTAAAALWRVVVRRCRWGRGFLPHEAVSGVGEWHEVPRVRGPQDRGETTVGFLARFARAPSPPPAVLPRSAAAPRGRGVGRRCRWGRGFLPHDAVSGVGEWHEVPRGRGP